MAASQSYESCRILLEHGADLGNRDADGKTPLHVFFSPVVAAILTGHREAVSEEMAVRDAFGMTILQYAAWSSKSESRHLECYVQGGHAYACIARDGAGRTLLHFAAQRGNLALLSYLLDLPVNPGVEALDADGQTALHYAVHSKRTEAIDLLLMHGASPNAVDFKGRTLLHCAARRNNLVAARKVLELCGQRSVRARDRYGMTPAELAYQHKAYDVVALLGYLTSGESSQADLVSQSFRAAGGPPRVTTLCFACYKLAACCHTAVSPWGLLLYFVVALWALGMVR